MGCERIMIGGFAGIKGSTYGRIAEKSGLVTHLYFVKGATTAS